MWRVWLYIQSFTALDPLPLHCMHWLDYWHHNSKVVKRNITSEKLPNSSISDVVDNNAPTADVVLLLNISAAQSEEDWLKLPEDTATAPPYWHYKVAKCIGSSALYLHKNVPDLVEKSRISRDISRLKNVTDLAIYIRLINCNRQLSPACSGRMDHRIRRNRTYYK